MAILLVHLRRLVLLLSIVYLSGAFMQRLLYDNRYAHWQQLYSKMLWPKQFHFQWWVYVYTGYTYLLLVNYVSVRRLTNLMEFFMS